MTTFLIVRDSTVISYDEKVRPNVDLLYYNIIVRTVADLVPNVVI